MKIEIARDLDNPVFQPAFQKPPNLCIIVVLEGDPALAISHQEIIKLAKRLEDAT